MKIKKLLGGTAILLVVASFLAPTNNTQDTNTHKEVPSYEYIQTTNNKKKHSDSPKIIETTNPPEPKEEVVEEKIEETTVNNFDTEFSIDYPRPSGNPLLKIGDETPEVGWLQSSLNRIIGTNIEVNCKFEDSTRATVVDFQERCGLEVDGVVGSATIDKMVSILSGNEKLPPKIIKTQPPVIETPVIETPAQPVETPKTKTYVLNNNTLKYHEPGCSEIKKIKEENKEYCEKTAEEIEAMGYTHCKRCS